MSKEKESRPRFRSASNSKLPRLSAVIEDRETMERCAALVVEGGDIKRQTEAMKARDEEIRAELAAICEAYGLPGFRHGLEMFEYHGWQTRQTLSKERLLALGVSAETLNAAYTESKPFLSAKIDPFDQE